MEGENDQKYSNISSSSSSGSRWKPTKEQISVLENLYKQGIKNPSSEEIQQITTRLRVHGNIEGKNVFYWFQNHKSREKQKQKQETIAFFNHPHPNAICTPPYCLPQAQTQGTLDLFPQHPTGILEEKKTTDHVSSIVSVSAVSSTDNKHSGSPHDVINQDDACYENQPLFDFYRNYRG